MINFSKFYTKFNILSSILIVASLILLIFKGLNFGIDFKGECVRGCSRSPVTNLSRGGA